MICSPQHKQETYFSSGLVSGRQKDVTDCSIYISHRNLVNNPCNCMHFPTKQIWLSFDQVVRERKFITKDIRYPFDEIEDEAG